MARRRQRYDVTATPESRRTRYLNDAAYYFFRAATEDEQLVSALHRRAAEFAKADLDRHMEEVPAPAAARALAVELFGEARCHAEAA